MKLTKEKRETLEENLKGWEKIAETGIWPLTSTVEQLHDGFSDIDRFLFSTECVESRKYYADRMIMLIKNALNKSK